MTPGVISTCALIGYEELLPIIDNLENNLTKEGFNKFQDDFFELINKSTKYMIFTEPNFIISLEYTDFKIIEEILRPISERQTTCFKNCLCNIYSHNRNSDIRAIIGEFIDCVWDYNKCYKKTYVSANEYLLFETLVRSCSIAINKNFPKEE